MDQCPVCGGPIWTSSAIKPCINPMCPISGTPQPPDPKS